MNANYHKNTRKFMELIARLNELDIRHGQVADADLGRLLCGEGMLVKYDLTGFVCFLETVRLNSGLTQSEPTANPNGTQSEPTPQG